MNTAISKRKKKRGSHRHQVKFPGITEDAKKLGVSRPHLWMVLTGTRTSGSLTRRYHALKTEVAS